MDNTLHYQSRDRKIDPSLLVLVGTLNTSSFIHSKSFRETDLSIKVDARVVAYVDGWTNERTENQIPISRNA